MSAVDWSSPTASKAQTSTAMTRTGVDWFSSSWGRPETCVHYDDRGSWLPEREGGEE